MWFYLETNALYALGTKLAGTGSKSYTSYWSIAEIVKSVTPDNFRKRHLLAMAVRQSRLKIDWSPITTKYHEAFGIHTPDHGLSNALKTVFRSLASESTFEGFREQIEDQGLSFEFKLFGIHDELEHAFRTEYANPLTRSAKDIYPRSIRNQLVELVNDAAMSKESGVLALAAIVANAVNKSTQTLVSAYDGTLDVFIVCNRQFLTRKIVEAGDWGRNDNADLHHLTYLQNPSCVIVTDDELLHGLVRVHFPRQVIHVADYRRRVIDPG